MRGHRVSVLVVLLLIAVAAASGCDWTPRPRIEVDSTGGDDDTDIGDGVCAIYGSPACTLTAAVQEANASGVSTDIVVPDGTYRLNEPVKGQVRINWLRGGDVRIDDLRVAAGGHLAINGLSTWLQSPVQVDGVMIARNSSLAPLNLADPDYGLRVGPGATVYLENTLVATPIGGPAVVNAGTLVMRQVTLMSSGVPGLFALRGPVLVTEGAGTTAMSSTAIAAYEADGVPSAPGVLACGGTAPVSGGSNAAFGTSCGLTTAGDQQGAPVFLVNAMADAFWAVAPAPGSPLIDAVAVGVNGCGGDFTSDAKGDPRPVDGDGDGNAACDIGAIERAAP